MEFAIIIGSFFGYPVMQVFMLVRRSSRVCRAFAALPLLVTIPMVTITIDGVMHHEYHASAVLFMISVPALFYLVIVFLASKAMGAIFGRVAGVEP
jgi:hypothetical protein